MIYKAFKDISLSRLGMGAMRLPIIDPKDPNSVDVEASRKIFDAAYAGGINYYDTAYAYSAGNSERALGICMSKYPRDSFYVASKFSYHANPDYKQVFETQLERLQMDRIDFYLIHCLLDSNIEDYLGCGCIDYFLEQKRLGRIKYLGFSSHASVETLERFASHHDWDFAQIQLNYYDWSYSRTAMEYEVLKNHNIPIMVMEPVRGGRLAKLTDSAEAILKDAQPDWSVPAWAMRFVKGLPQVQTILSGMSTVEQVEDNLKTFADADGLTKVEQDILGKALREFKSTINVPCTGCRYCCDDCPMQINIPEYLKFYNNFKISGKWALSSIDKVESQGKPADCIGCGSCKSHCPQSIDVPKCMAELAEAMNN